jgi:hypothetical protein
MLKYRVQYQERRSYSRTWRTVETCVHEESAQAYAAAYRIDRNKAGALIYPDLRIVQGTNVVSEWRGGERVPQGPTIGERVASLEKRLHDLIQNLPSMEGAE